MDVEFINAYIAKQKALIDDFQQRLIVAEVRNQILEQQLAVAKTELDKNSRNHLRAKMLNLFHVFPAAVSSQKCDELIQRGLQLPSQNASIGFNEDRVDNSYRISTIRWFYAPENRDIVDLMMYYATISNRDSFGFDISFGAHEFQFTEYHGSNNGKYDWHHDVWWDNPRLHDRKLSVIIQLSDPANYEGGNFQFRMPHDSSQLEAFKHRGSVLVFPSFFEHCVTPVTAGTRYSLVTWVDGPKFR